jgi:hypothetical protein
MDRVFDAQVNNPSSFYVMYMEFLGFSIVGLSLGLAIDLCFSWCIRRLKERKWFTNIVRIVLVFLQITASIIVLSALSHFTSHLKWEEHWQATTPGMAFSSFFFGIQFNIFTLLHHN